MTSTVVQETETAAMLRLLKVARESGVKLRRDDKGGYWASSVSQPGMWHVVTAHTCTCQGFGKAGRCRHLAALHAHLGWLPGTHPQDAEVATVAPTLPNRPRIEVVHTPAGWHEDDINGTDRYYWKPDRTSIMVDGVERVRVSGDDTAVYMPGTLRATDLRPKGTHYDTVVRYIRELNADADVDRLLADAELFRSDEFLDEVFERVVA